MRGRGGRYFSAPPPKFEEPPEVTTPASTLGGATGDPVGAGTVAPEPLPALAAAKKGLLTPCARLPQPFVWLLRPNDGSTEHSELASESSSDSAGAPVGALPLAPMLPSSVDAESSKTPPPQGSVLRLQGCKVFCRGFRGFEEFRWLSLQPETVRLVRNKTGWRTAASFIKSLEMLQDALSSGWIVPQPILLRA